jgi:hypothetical protein
MWNYRKNNIHNFQPTFTRKRFVICLPTIMVVVVVAVVRSGGGGSSQITKSVTGMYLQEHSATNAKNPPRWLCWPRTVLQDRRASAGTHIHTHNHYNLFGSDDSSPLFLYLTTGNAPGSVLLPKFNLQWPRLWDAVGAKRRKMYNLFTTVPINTSVSCNDGWSRQKTVIFLDIKNRRIHRTLVTILSIKVSIFSS